MEKARNPRGIRPSKRAHIDFNARDLPGNDPFPPPRADHKERGPLNMENEKIENK
jgi:hypothetical protein